MEKRVKKIVIPAAGIGSRLLPITKEIPKEMMPLFLKSKNGQVSVKPLIQILFEKFYNLQIKEFCIVVGKQKRTIEDHFTSNLEFLENFTKDNKFRQDLEKFYEMLNSAKIFWVNQSGPKGFGDAVLCAESFVGDEEFIVSAGDTLIPNNDEIIKKLLQTKITGKNDAILILKKVENPKRFGVAVVKKLKNKTLVTNVEEKPLKPKSNLSIVALYRFKPSIFSALKEIKMSKKELQLTSGIQKLIERGGNIHAIILNDEDRVIDIGTADSYLETIQQIKSI